MIALLAKNANNVFATGPGEDRKLRRAVVYAWDLSSSFLVSCDQKIHFDCFILLSAVA